MSRTKGKRDGSERDIIKTAILSVKMFSIKLQAVMEFLRKILIKLNRQYENQW